MRMLLVAFVGMIFLQGCEEEKIVRKEPRNQQFVEFQGVVNDGYMKRFPYSMREGGNEWALDVIRVPEDKLGKEVAIVARATKVDGIRVLTEVVLDGARLQTKKEWAKADSEADPFGW
jgi:hypothetical protein